MSAFPDVFRPGLKKRQVEFLWHFIQHGSIARASRFSGDDRKRHYDWQRSSSLYAECFTAARNHVAGALEDEANDRATEGVEEPVFGKTGILGYRIRKSDELLMLLLKANNPEKFSKSGQSQGATGIQIVNYSPSSGPPPAEWDASGEIQLRVSLPAKAPCDSGTNDPESVVPAQNTSDSSGSSVTDSP